MKTCGVGRIVFALGVLAFLSTPPAQAQETAETASAATVPVGMTVTLSAAAMPTVNRDDVMVTRGRRDRLKVTGWTAATGDRAGFDLFIVIDDASATQLGKSTRFPAKLYQRSGLDYVGRGGLRAERNRGDRAELYD